MSALAIAGVMFAALLGADEWNKKTLVTFDQSVEISGHVLVAGTYVFQLADSSSNRHIVRISNRHGRAVVATVLAIPNYRLPTTHGPVIPFNDAAIGSPQAIRARFYPGSNRPLRHSPGCSRRTTTGWMTNRMHRRRAASECSSVQSGTATSRMKA